MRALPQALEDAQQAASGVPFVRTEVETRIRGVQHLRFSQTFSDFVADDRHDAEADADYLHRVRISGNPLGIPQYERDAGGGWTNLNAGFNDANVIAVAATNDERVAVVYNRGPNIFFAESIDQGSSFSSEINLGATFATPKAVAIAYKNTTGDLCVFWEDSDSVGRRRRTAGAWGSALGWTQSANSVNGLSAIRAGDFCLAVTGTDASDRPFVKTLILGDGVSFPVDTWTAFFVVIQAEEDQGITFQAPFLHAGPAWWITYVEKFSGSPAYTRTYWTTRLLQEVFSPGDWEWLDPAPFDNDSQEGLAIASNVNTVYYSRPAFVWEAPVSPSPGPLDMSSDLIEATMVEEGLSGEGEFVFDNAEGQYAGPPSPIELHRDLDIGLGYDTLYSRPPRQTITGWEYRRSGGKSMFVLFTRGPDYWLERSHSRTAMSLGSLPLGIIARGAAARAGLEQVNTGSSTRAVTYNLTWTFHPHQSGLSALLGLIELMPDIFRALDSATVQIFEPTASDPVDYDYEAQGHALYERRVRDNGVASVAEVLGDGVLGQAFDFALMRDDKPIEDRRRDPHAAVAGDANDHAVARLRKAVLRQDRGYIVAPPHCGLEVGDVVAYSDALVSGSEITGRVRAIRTRFRRAGPGPTLFEQRIELGGV